LSRGTVFCFTVAHTLLHPIRKRMEKLKVIPALSTFGQLRMKTDRREQIRQSLRSLAESYAGTMELMEQTVTLLCEELSLDSWSYFKARAVTRNDPGRPCALVIDPSLFTVTFQGKTCFLGNTLPFRLLTRLAKRPNAYVSHSELLTDVWDAVRSEGAIRAIVKVLRQRLNQAQLGPLADAIDGTVRGHYALKLDQ
jgi:DNA-binding response OmpR family regulator